MKANKSAVFNGNMKASFTGLKYRFLLAMLSRVAYPFRLVNRTCQRQQVAANGVHVVVARHAAQMQANASYRPKVCV
jgi:hypothetical protein